MLITHIIKFYPNNVLPTNLFRLCHQQDPLFTDFHQRKGVAVCICQLPPTVTQG